MKIVLEEYIAIARQIKITHKQLLQLLEKTQEKMPPEVVHPLLKMEDYLFLFKERAEKQMLEDCPQVINLQTEDYPDYSHIFYGGFKDIDNLSK